jgi:hypothetical protein
MIGADPAHTGVGGSPMRRSAFGPARLAPPRHSPENTSEAARVPVAGGYTAIPAHSVQTSGLLALQRAAGNKAAVALLVTRATMVQRDKGDQNGGFLSEEDPAAQKELEKKVAEFEKKGKSKEDAIFLAMDDMYAERVRKAGGKRIPKSATPGKAGKTKTLIFVTEPMAVGEKYINSGPMNATIDDGVYNCHSYTLDEGKKSKLTVLNGLTQKIPKEAGIAGNFFDSKDLVKNGIFFDPHITLDIFPRWVGDAEMRTHLKDYKALAVGEKVAVGDIVVYTVGSTLPHSGRVIAVDKKGNATMIRSKWGYQSLFEHPPLAVPAHYGTPTFYRKK